MSDLPDFIRVTMASRLSRLSLDRLRAMADRGEFARRYILGGLDYFKVSEFLDSVEKLPGDPKRLRDERDFLDWQAAGRPRAGHRQDRGRRVAARAVQVIEAGRVAGRLVRSLEGRPVVAPASDAQHCTEAAPVLANVAREPRAVLFHTGRVPTMGARAQENAAESVDSVAKSRSECGERDTKAMGCQRLASMTGLPASARVAALPDEAISSPVGAVETDGFAPKGAKVAAKNARREWGLSESDLAIGYAQCAEVARG